MTTKHISISQKDQARTQVLTKQKGLVVPDTLGMSDRMERYQLLQNELSAPSRLSIYLEPYLVVLLLQGAISSF